MIMVSRGKLMPWTSLFTLSKVTRSMVSVLPPPPVSWPTRRKVYTPSFRPLLATLGSSAPSKVMSPSSVVTVPEGRLGTVGRVIQARAARQTAMARTASTTRN